MINNWKRSKLLDTFQDRAGHGYNRVLQLGDDWPALFYFNRVNSRWSNTGTSS
jgi:hypothetical protein